MPRSRLNEAMGFVQTGISGGIAPGCLAGGGGRRRARRVGRVLDGASISATLAALSGILIRDSGPAEENASDAAATAEG